MAQDIFWNVETRDIEFTSDGDFLLTTNPSTQNGGIMLEARAMNILFPAMGIGFNSQVLGSNAAQASLQLNRWNSQIRSDGGASSWSRLNNPPNVQFDFTANVAYNQ